MPPTALLTYLIAFPDPVESSPGSQENIRENFSLSRSDLMGQVELAGWLILLIGYFILFFIDTGVIINP